MRRYTNSIMRPIKPIMRIGKRIWPYIRMGLPLVLLIAFIAFQIFIWWYGPKLEINNEYPLKSFTMRLLISIASILLILVFIALFQRKEIRDYYRDKEEDALLRDDISVQYVERQKNDLSSLLDHLRENYKGKNYLYGIPWYMVIGLDNSGKTSLINRSEQEFYFSTALKASSFKSNNPYQFDWWISDDAIIIDPNSELLSQAPMQDLDKGEEDPQIARHLWLHFLNWVVELRPQRPLNGIILTVDIAYLANANVTNRKVYAGILRARLKELSDCLGSQLPIYIVLTKIDLLNGFSQFFKDIKREEREKIFGFTFDINKSKDKDEWLKEFEIEYESFIYRINDLLMKLLLETRDEKERSSLYSFTRQLSGIKGIVVQLLREVLASDKFTTEPIVRGVYFTSVYQQGVPADVFVNATAKRYGFNSLITSAQNNLYSLPHFTKDLFQKVIYPESGLATDNLASIEQRQKRLVTAGILSTMAVMLGVYSFHYYYNKNHESLNNVRKNVVEFKKKDIKEYLDPTGKILEEPLNLIGAATLEFGYFHERSKYFADLGLYQGHNVGPEVEETYLKLLSYRYLPALLSGVAQDLTSAEAGSDQQLELLRIFRMMINRDARQSEMVLDYFSNYWQKVFEGNAELQDNLMNHLDYALRHTDLDYDRKIRLREAERALSPYDDLVKKAQMELVAIPMEHRIYRSFKQYGLSILGAPLDLRLEVGPAFDIIFNHDADDREKIRIPSLFTKRGVDRYYVKHSDEIYQLAIIDNWVIGEEKAWDVDERHNLHFSDKDLISFRDKLRDQYGKDYERTWRTVLNELEINEFKDINHGVMILDNIVGNSQPFNRLLSAIKKNTDFIPELPEGDKAEEELKRSHRYLLSKEISNNFRDINQLSADVAHIDKEAVTPSFSEEVMLAIQNLHDYLKYVETAQEPGKMALKIARDRIDVTDADPIYSLKRISERLPQPFNRLVGKLADETWNVILLEAIKEIDKRWNNEVYKEFNTRLANKYPFDPLSSHDVSLEEFEHFFGKEGTITQFYEEDLAPFLNDSLFKSKSGDDYKSLIKHEVIAQIDNAQKIRQAFFNRHGVLGVEFTMTPLSMGPQVQRSVLNIEGQFVVYTHGPKQGYSLIWPNVISDSNQQAIVKLTMTGGNQQQRILSYSGPWALFRMIDAGHITSVDSHRLTLSYNLRNVPMRYELTAQGDVNPFTLSLLRSFVLSPSLYK